MQAFIGKPATWQPLLDEFLEEDQSYQPSEPSENKESPILNT